MKSTSTMSLSGRLSVEKIAAPKAPLSWKLKNMARWSYLFGRSANRLARVWTGLTGIPTLSSELSVRLIKADGRVVNYGVVNYRLVTTAFVEFVVDQLQVETSVFGDFKFHDSGVGVTAANVTDTYIETTDGESRATGTQTESTSVIYESVPTISYTTTKAITEHGLFNASTGVTLMDRHTFASIGVVNGDSIQFTFDLTVSDGG